MAGCQIIYYFMTSYNRWYDYTLQVGILLGKELRGEGEWGRSAKCKALIRMVVHGG